MVTGGTGFVGSHLVASLAARGDRVRVVFHNASVVHTKQNKVVFVWRVNHDGTRHVLAACQAHRIPKLVYVSSGSVVYEGKDIENGDESLPYSSISQAPHADSKIEAEKEVLAQTARRAWPPSRSGRMWRRRARPSSSAGTGGRPVQDDGEDTLGRLLAV